MKRCWILIVTRGLKVWLPPEVYLQHDLAVREAERWRVTLRLPAVNPSGFSPNARCLHLLPSMFPEPWRACPVWVGVTWTERSYPRPRIALMPVDEQEAASWLRRRIPRSIEVTERTASVMYPRPQ